MIFRSPLSSYTKSCPYNGLRPPLLGAKRLETPCGNVGNFNPPTLQESSNPPITILTNGKDVALLVERQELRVLHPLHLIILSLFVTRRGGKLHECRNIILLLRGEVSEVNFTSLHDCILRQPVCWLTSTIVGLFPQLPMAPIAGSQKLSLFHAVLHYSSDKQHLKYRNLEDEIERYGICGNSHKKPTVHLNA